ARNGEPNDQALMLCSAIRSQCASEPEQIHAAETDDQLEDTLVAIAVKLRDGSDYDHGTTRLVD
ncbi:MAG: hypothetical protein ACRCUC_16165, partial [Aestuariivirga sp.]